MTRISRQRALSPVPIRSSDRRSGGAGVINPVEAVSPDRRADGRDLRKSVGTRRGDYFHSPHDRGGIDLGSAAFAYMHVAGEHEREQVQARTNALAVTERYEAQYFPPLRPGLLTKQSA